MIVKIIVNNYIKIYINGILHISIKLEDYQGMQSYIDDFYFVIEFYTKTKTIICEYDSVIKWKKILKSIDKMRL